MENKLTNRAIQRQLRQWMHGLGTQVREGKLDSAANLVRAIGAGAQTFAPMR